MSDMSAITVLQYVLLFVCMLAVICLLFQMTNRSRARLPKKESPDQSNERFVDTNYNTPPTFKNKITNPYLTPCMVEQNANESTDPYFHYDVPITSSSNIRIPDMSFIKWCTPTHDGLGLEKCESLHEKLLVLNTHIDKQATTLDTLNTSVSQALSKETPLVLPVSDGPYCDSKRYNTS
jgi:hypothetical protein